MGAGGSGMASRGAVDSSSAVVAYGCLLLHNFSGDKIGTSKQGQAVARGRAPLSRVDADPPR